MKLAAIYNVFDGEELLAGSVQLIRPEVAFLIAIVQLKSNRGEVYEGGVHECARLNGSGLIDIVSHFTPDLQQPARVNEARKRQKGVQIANQLGATHFLHLDCDEYYDPLPFRRAKTLVLEQAYEGTVCRLKTYFGACNLQLRGFDVYHVPFIHRLLPSTNCGFCAYPFTVDPTRSVNSSQVAEMPPEVIFMHHFSWVRRDIGRKIRNSSSDVFSESVRLAAIEDFERARAGLVVRLYQKELIEVTLPKAVQECFKDPSGRG